MKPFHHCYLLIFCMLVFAYCKKQKINLPQPPVEQLPAATQEGKNTCGFLVNGKLWLPKGKLGNGQPNLSWWYDPAYRNGTFNISGVRYDKSEGDKFTGFSMAIDNFFSVGTYSLNVIDGRGSQYSDFNRNCIYYHQDTLFGHKSLLTITKFDTQNRIIAGIFEFSLAKPGCDTIRITEGRFDIKF